MRKILLSIFAFLICLSVYSQDYFLKKHHLGATLISGEVLDNLDDDSYLIAGLKVIQDTSVYLYIGLLDDLGGVMQYDSIKETEPPIAISLNNDFAVDDQNGIKFISTDLGRVFIYNYNPALNELTTETIDTVLGDDFITIDFITTSDNGYIFAGVEAFNGYSKFSLHKVTSDSVIDFIVEPAGTENIYDKAHRIFENSDGTFDVLGRFKSDMWHSTARVYTFDHDLNLLKQITPDTSVQRTEFTEAIKDRNGNYIYCCRMFYENPTGDQSTFAPMISQLSADGVSSWDLEIGRSINSVGLISGWFGLTEALEGDGYVAAGTMMINAVQRDTLKTLGALVKVSTEGDSVWYREFSTIDTSYASTNFRDVVTTQDGYMIIGDEQCWSGYSDCERENNLLILRTDSEGRIEPDSSTAVVTVDGHGEFDLAAYPNPCLDQFYLQHELRRPTRYFLMDSQGRVLQEIEVGETMETVRVPMQQYSAGSYYLQMMGQQGEILNAVKLLKQ